MSMHPLSRIEARQWSRLLPTAAIAVLAGQAYAAPLSVVLDRKELVLCAAADALPYSRERGEQRGFQIDLARAIAADLGVELRVKYSRLHREPRRGECDAMMTAAVPKHAAGDADYRVTDAYMAYQPLLVISSSRPPIAALGDFAPGRIAVISGSWAHFLLTERKIPVWVRFHTDEEMLAAVETGEAQGAIVSNFGYDWYRHQHPGSNVRAATELPLDDDLGFDVAIGLMGADQALIDRVNVALARLLEAGVVDATLARYGIERRPPSSAAR